MRVILEAVGATKFNTTFWGKQRRQGVKFGQRLRDGLLQGVDMAWYNQNGDTQHSRTPSYQVWCYQNGDTQHTVGHLVIRFGVTKTETHNTAGHLVIRFGITKTETHNTQ